jgi:NDP-sugar pyrophosphorylase family protein
MRAVILAGGKGTRLRPYTVAIPKPLVPVSGDTPILSVLLKQLKKNGFNHVTLAVSHMAEIIMAYAGDGSKWGLKIDYSIEKEQLHTIGALTIIKDLPEHFLVVNGDTLTDLHYGEFLKEHTRRGNDISVAAKKREVKIDFGVLSFDKNQLLTDFTEKPTHVAHVAMGVNCFSSSVIESLNKGEWYGFDDLMKDSLKQGRKVLVKPHDGFWIDIGRPEDYQYAVDHDEDIQKFLDTSA